MKNRTPKSQRIKTSALSTLHSALPRAAFCFLLLAFCSSCEKGEQPDCIKSTGKIIKEERVVGVFHTIHTLDNINIVFTNDTTQTITVEAGENLMSDIKTDVTDGFLNISNENKCNWVRSYKKRNKKFL